jgi:hypothetical protein
MTPTIDPPPIVCGACKRGRILADNRCDACGTAIDLVVTEYQGEALTLTRTGYNGSRPRETAATGPVLSVTVPLGAGGPLYTLAEFQEAVRRAGWPYESWLRLKAWLPVRA